VSGKCLTFAFLYVVERRAHSHGEWKAGSQGCSSGCFTHRTNTDPWGKIEENSLNVHDIPI